MTESMTFEEAGGRCAELVANVERVIVGKRDVVIRAASALLAQGHILIEDVPGVGKTMLAKALARSVSGGFKRIQFTADLLPSDITGVNIFQQADGEFVFRPGPLFTNVLLGDEINRATPRTQSSLLEAMEEMQATVDGVRYDVESPFLVIATQNPIEIEGTYPLPFAQMDRFMVRLRIGYLDPVDERRMIQSRMEGSPIDTLTPALSRDELVQLQKLAARVMVREELVDYIVSIVTATRASGRLEFGASPRGGLDLMRYSQATALVNGRDFVLPDDIKASAASVLAHRVIVQKGTRHGTLNTDELIDEIVEGIPVPV